MHRTFATLVSALLLSSVMVGLGSSVASAVPATRASAAGPAAAQGQGRSYYGQTSRKVAKRIGCKGFFVPKGGGPGELNRDSGKCRLRGKTVNVITFRDPAQQRGWNLGARYLLPSNHWWANGKGALVIAYNGNKAAAKAGAKALPGRLVKAL